jgi:hypothetical protein
MKRLFWSVMLLAASAGGAAAQAHVLIVSGIGGEPRYVDDFHSWGTAMVDAARGRFGLPDANVVYLAEDPARDPGRIDGQSRREEVERALAEMARRAAPEDRILILLIGHGSSDSRGTRLNLPGPNLTAEELAAMLQGFRTQPLVVVNTASASGGFQEPLAGPNRTIITATRTGSERNETMFGGFFVAAFADDGADTDRDGRVTVAEAFEYATRETERAYRTANRLQLEHGRIEGDLELARRFHLAASGMAAAPAGASAELQALFAERQRLEEGVEALRLRASRMDGAEYRGELERLLLELARTNRAIREQEGEP